MTSMEAGRAVAEGIHRADAGAEVLVRPLADGGEGMVEALTSGMNGSRQQVQVTGPLGTPVICEYGIIEAWYGEMESGTGRCCRIPLLRYYLRHQP